MTLRSAVNIVVLRALIDRQPRPSCVSGLFRAGQKMVSRRALGRRWGTRPSSCLPLTFIPP